MRTIPRPRCGAAECSWTGRALHALGRRGVRQDRGVQRGDDDEETVTGPEEALEPSEAVPESAGNLAAVRRQVEVSVAAGADEAVQRVISAVHRVSRRLNQWYDQQLADLGVSGGEWSVLAEIARAHGNQLTPTRLAQLTHVAPSSMTHRLDRMVERGLVERSADPTNRTRILVGLTEAGWELYGVTIRESNLVESDLMRGLTARQVDDLGHLLEKLLAGLDSSPITAKQAALAKSPSGRSSSRTPGAGADG